MSAPRQLAVGLTKHTNLAEVQFYFADMEVTEEGDFKANLQALGRLLGFKVEIQVN